MCKKQQIKIYVGGLLIALASLGSACSSGTATAQTPRAKPAAASPTPEYKPPKRVSRDVIDSDRKEEAPKAKTKK